MIYRQWVMFVLYGKSEVTEMSAEHVLTFFLSALLFVAHGS